MAKRIRADVSKVRERVKGAAGRGKAPREKKAARPGAKVLRANWMEAEGRVARIGEALSKCEQERSVLQTNAAALVKELSRLTSWLEEDRQRLAASNSVVEAQAKRIEELKASAPVLYVRELEAERDGLRARCQALTMVETELRQERCQRAKLAETVARADEAWRQISTQREVALAGEKAALARVEELSASNLRLVDEWRAKWEGETEARRLLQVERERLLAAQSDHIRQIEGLQAAVAPVKAERDELLVRLREANRKLADQGALLALDAFGEVERLTQALELAQKARLEAEGLAVTAEKYRVEAMARVKELEAEAGSQKSPEEMSADKDALAARVKELEADLHHKELARSHQHERSNRAVKRSGEAIALAEKAQARVKELEARQAAVEPELVEARAFRDALAKFLHPGKTLMPLGNWWNCDPKTISNPAAEWTGPVGGGLAARLAAGEGA